MSFFDPSLARRGLDLLLMTHPHLDLVAAWIPGREGDTLLNAIGTPWLRVDLGQKSEGETDAYAVWSYAIWRHTGAVHQMRDGAVDDDPLIEPEPEIDSHDVEVRRVIRYECRIETLRELRDLVTKIELPLTSIHLDELIDECERATMPFGEVET